eukprot:gene6981-7531_t
MSKIQWTDELKYLLFRVVQEEGAHLTEYGKTDEKWMRVNDKFFSQKETIFLKEVHYQKDKHRKLKDKFKEILTSCTEYLSSGNTSNEEGELSDLYELAKQLQKEKEDFDVLDQLGQ